MTNIIKRLFGKTEKQKEETADFYVKTYLENTDIGQMMTASNFIFSYVTNKGAMGGSHVLFNEESFLRAVNSPANDFSAAQHKVALFVVNSTNMIDKLEKAYEESDYKQPDVCILWTGDEKKPAAKQLPVVSIRQINEVKKLDWKTLCELVKTPETDGDIARLDNPVKAYLN